jgi:hypothetical protein
MATGDWEFEPESLEVELKRCTEERIGFGMLTGILVKT